MNNTRRCGGCQKVVPITKLSLVGWVLVEHHAGENICGWSGEVVSAPRKKKVALRQKAAKLTTGARHV